MKVELSAAVTDDVEEVLFHREFPWLAADSRPRLATTLASSL
jgi:hypothetical protein